MKLVTKNSTLVELGDGAYSWAVAMDGALEEADFSPFQRAYMLTKCAAATIALRQKIADEFELNTLLKEMV